MVIFALLSGHHQRRRRRRRFIQQSAGQFAVVIRMILITQCQCTVEVPMSRLHENAASGRATEFTRDKHPLYQTIRDKAERT